MIALKSPPPRRITILRGQPKNTRAPITTTIPITNLVAGEEPALGLNSPFARAITNPPATIPTISGLIYCTLSAR